MTEHIMEDYRADIETRTNPHGNQRGFPEGHRVSAKYHTTTPELAELASEAKPRLLILYHYSSLSPEELVSDMLGRYSGHFVVGRDLDIY